MIESIKISGFKNFRGKSIELKGMNRINLLVGINGSGKSSVLELLVGVSKLSQLNGDENQDILVGKLAPRLHSLFEPETEISFTYTTSPDNYHLKITTMPGDRWQVQKNGKPSGGTDVVALLGKNAVDYGTNMVSSNRRESPFGGISGFDTESAIVLPDLNYANDVLAKVNPSQRSLRPMNLSSGQFTFEDEKEVQLKFLAGGNRYIAGLSAAIREMRNSKPILVVDDLGDELFPAIRKILIPEINNLLEGLPENKFAQMFATTHNIEIVKSALNHPEFCSVYMFDYNGALVEFKGTKQHIVKSTIGVKSVDSVTAISKMLGINDIDLGYPELVLLVEEESKKTFIESLLNKNPLIKENSRNVDILVPFQTGDGNTAKAIQNLLDLSKYLIFSEIWSDRYAIFVDYNEADYEPNGIAKTAGTRQRALFATQERLGLDARFLLTSKNNQYVLSLEDTYPKNLWDRYRSENDIPPMTPDEYVMGIPRADRGKVKNDMASFMGTYMTSKQLVDVYPYLAKLLSRNAPIPLDEINAVTLEDEPLVNEEVADIYEEAKRIVLEAGKASASLLQRRLRVGYARAARLIDELESRGVVGPSDGPRPRTVLLSLENL